MSNNPLLDGFEAGLTKEAVTRGWIMDKVIRGSRARGASAHQLKNLANEKKVMGSFLKTPPHKGSAGTGSRDAMRETVEDAQKNYTRLRKQTPAWKRRQAKKYKAWATKMHKVR